MITTTVWPAWIRCWCDWSTSEDPGVSHDVHVRANDYPDHEPATEWNLPEPTVAELGALEGERGLSGWRASA